MQMAARPSKSSGKVFRTLVNFFYPCLLYATNKKNQTVYSASKNCGWQRTYYDFLQEGNALQGKNIFILKQHQAQTGIVLLIPNLPPSAPPPSKAPYPY